MVIRQLSLGIIITFQPEAKTQKFCGLERLNAMTQYNLPPLAQNLSPITADWAAMNADQQREYFGDNGFLVVPSVMCAAEIQLFLQEIEALGSPRRLENELWTLPAFVPQVSNSKLVAAVSNLLGPDLRFFKAAYTATIPGSPCQPLHLDQNTCSSPGDYRNTSASWLNVGIYLTDLTPEHAPLWVVPGSNKRYDLIPGANMEALQPKARMVLARAGDAVLFHRSTLHAAGANHSDRVRHGVFLSYRPAWAKPTGPIAEWAPEHVHKIRPRSRYLVTGLNDGT